VLVREGSIFTNYITHISFMRGGTMSYQSFRERMRLVAQQAALSRARQAPEYQCLVEILEANEDSRQAERTL
jgi:hypothetical protein